MRTSACSQQSFPRANTKAHPTFDMRYFVDRWYSAVPLPRLFWRDMILVGTVVNLAATVLSIIVWDLGYGAFAATLIFFAPVPYNMFLAIAVWRASEVLPHSIRLGTRAAAVFWLMVVTLI